MGRKTMQMHSVETSAGTAICAAPVRIASVISLPISRLRSMFLDLDGSVVDQDADGEGETAEGHDVDGLADEAEDDDGGEDGERDGDGDDDGRAPGAEEEQDHQAGEDRRAIDRLADDADDRGSDEDGLIADGGDAQSVWQGCSWICGRRARTCLTTVSVEAEPLLSTVSSTARWPSCRTILV